MLTSRKTDRVRTRIRSDEHRDAHADRDSIANPGQSGRDDGTGNNPGVVKPCWHWLTAGTFDSAQATHFILIYTVHLKVIWAVDLKCCNQGLQIETIFQFAIHTKPEAYNLVYLLTEFLHLMHLLESLL